MRFPSLLRGLVLVLSACAAFGLAAVASAAILSPGATGCVIYRAGAYETDDRFRIAEYASYDDFRTGTVFKARTGEVLRLTPGNKPIIIPYPSEKADYPEAIRERIAEAKGRFRHLAMDLAAIEQAWGARKADQGDGAAPPSGPATPQGETVARALELKSGRVLRDWAVSKVAGDKVTVNSSLTRRRPTRSW